MPQRLRIEPGTTVDLAKTTTSGKQFHDDRDEAEREFKLLRAEIDTLETRLYAENRQQLLVVFQAMDGGGKDGTSRAVFKECNPQGMHIVSFKVPSAREQAHDFLWRIHQEVPARRMIGVFIRSHYEDVVVVRVDNLVPKPVWQPRFEQINQFEKYLTETGTRILKFFLHISRDEQLRTLQDRLEDPTKHWKFSADDIRKRAQWDHYMTAYGDAISNCSTPHAPWYVIPADQNWYRNWAVAKIVVETLKDMNPQFPPLDPKLVGLRLD